MTTTTVKTIDLRAIFAEAFSWISGLKIAGQKVSTSFNQTNVVTGVVNADDDPIVLEFSDKKGKIEAEALLAEKLNPDDDDNLARDGYLAYGISQTIIPSSDQLVFLRAISELAQDGIKADQIAELASRLAKQLAIGTESDFARGKTVSMSKLTPELATRIIAHSQERLDILRDLFDLEVSRETANNEVRETAKATRKKVEKKEKTSTNTNATPPKIPTPESAIEKIANGKGSALDALALARENKLVTTG